MTKNLALSALALAAISFSGVSSAADSGKVTYVSALASTSAVLPGQTGSLNTLTPYDLGTIGSAPGSVAAMFSLAEQALFANGTDLTVFLDIPGAASFEDYIKFVIPTPSSTTTNNAVFNISVFSTIISQFAAYSVDLYAGAPAFVPAGPALSSLSYTAGQLAAPVAQGTFTDLLTPGSYYLQVKGVAIGVNPIYNMQIIAAPVPEVSTYTMLLAGMAVVGFVASRRKAG